MSDEPEAPKPKVVQNYPANSHKKREEARPKVESVVKSGVTRKAPGFGQKFRAAFTGDDAQTIGDYLLFDVFVPAFKNLIFDGLTQGAQRALFGGERPGGRVTQGRNGNYTAYNRASQRTVYSPNAAPGAAPVGRQSGGRHNFDNLILDNRGDAEAVLDGLQALIDEYGAATVTDFYELMGETGEFTDQKWGWANISTASVSRITAGYVINLPRPVVLD